MKKKLILWLLFICSCSEKNEYFIKPIENFEILRYLGTWHEIARTNNSFEKGCTKATANYQIRSDGGINVLNECYNNGKRKEARGRAYFKDSANIGSLKVTFFWPFYGNYYIIYLDKNYSDAIVYGGNPDYIWILSRNEKITKIQLDYLLAQISKHGLDAKSLIISDSSILP
jgi:apolipoprotein D and lipocalin family protein